MIEAETSLLEAVRNRLRSECSYRDAECDVELDDQVPAIAGDRYVAVVPMGMRQGPRHNSSGGAFDLLLGCRVTVFLRMADVPRDRRRSVFLERTRGINAELGKVMRAIDFSYAVTTAANDLEESLNGSEGFIEPLRFISMDDKPQPVAREPFDAASALTKGSDPILAIKRGISFHGARFLKVR